MSKLATSPIMSITIRVYQDRVSGAFVQGDFCRYYNTAVSPEDGDIDDLSLRIAEAVDNWTRVAGGRDGPGLSAMR